MKLTIAAMLAITMAAAISAQETKPVPKDSQRVMIPGCTKGMIFTAARRTEDRPGSADIPEGMHLRMSGAKKMMAEIKGHEGQMIELTGLIKKGQLDPRGVGIGGGVRVAPGPSPMGGGGITMGSGVNQIVIDVEGWRPVVGECPASSR